MRHYEKYIKKYIFNFDFYEKTIYNLRLLSSNSTQIENRIKSIHVTLILKNESDRIKEQLISSILLLESLTGGFLHHITSSTIKKRYLMTVQIGVQFRIHKSTHWYFNFLSLLSKLHSRRFLVASTRNTLRLQFPRISFRRLLFMVDLLPRSVPLYKYFDNLPLMFTYKFNFVTQGTTYLVYRLILSYYGIPVL